MFENDPLLTNRPTLEELAKQNELYSRKLQELQQLPKPPQTASVWQEIDNAISSLNEQEKSVIANDKDYCDTNIAIQDMVNTEILNLVKEKIENSPDGKALLDRQLAIVRKLAKSAKEDTAKRENLFREYITEHSNLTWQQFTDLKNTRQ